MNLRPEFLPGSGSEERSDAERSDDDRFEILIVGGSQGAHGINVAMVEAEKELAAGRSRLRQIGAITADVTLTAANRRVLSRSAGVDQHDATNSTPKSAPIEGPRSTSAITSPPQKPATSRSHLT